MFTDVATIKVQAGKGGDGRLSFRSSRGNPKGGPDGGDGGRGGNVILKVSHNTNTLSKYRVNRLWTADHGEPGGTNQRHGKNGSNTTLIVPNGTVISENGEQIADLTQEGEEVIVAQGGSGGFGNTHFKSSIRQAPKMAELGEDGEFKEITLELKLIADVGLVGLPNAGKSTLLSMVSNAKPEIAGYAFTTLSPNLGVVDVHDDSFLIADIPGLIEGASKGKGLGVDFLRHVERCSVLLHLIDVNSTDIIKDYDTIRTELQSYSVDLSDREFIVVLTKSETIAEAKLKRICETLAKHIGVSPDKIHTISAVTTMGLQTLMQDTNKMLLKAQKQATKKTDKVEDEMKVITIGDEIGFTVEKKSGYYKVIGEDIERFARKTNLDQPDGVRRLKDILKKKGVYRELAVKGAKKGDRIKISGKDMIW
jgi:GTP-binding protein